MTRCILCRRRRGVPTVAQLEVPYPEMAKRVRGGVRPGQRRPTERRPAIRGTSPTPASGITASPTPATPRTTGLTEAEAARAAELEAQLLAEERAAEQARRRTRERQTARDVAPAGTLSVRASEEYAYVARDVKDIIRIASILLTILAVLYILIDVAKVVTLN